MKQKLNEVFPNWLTGQGIFSALQDFNVPWKDLNIQSDLDIAYHGNISGDKIISPLVRKMKSGETLTETEIELLASAIVAINGANWGKAWTALQAEYQPLDNYNMIEQMTNNETVFEYGKKSTRTDNLSHTKTGTETNAIDTNHTKTGTEKTEINTTDTETLNTKHTKTGTETTVKDSDNTLTLNTQTIDNLSETKTTQPNLTTNINNNVFGFNSASAAGSDTQTQTATGTNTDNIDRGDTIQKTGTEKTETDETNTVTYNTEEANTGTDTTKHTGDNTITYNTTEADTGNNTTTFNTTDTDSGTVTDQDSGQDVHTNNYTLTRFGNIGVTTSQQMLESELMLRSVWNFFYSIVFPDIDKCLTLRVY